MTVYMLWHGGYSYGTPELDQSERFDSIKDAKDAFWRRGDFDPYYPCVDETATAYLYRADPAEMADPYPDYEITYGPRGGVRVERVG